MKSTIVFALASVLGWGAAAAAQTESKGLEVALSMDAAESGYGDYTADVVMRLFNRKGEESVRSLRFKTRETPSDGDKSIVIFDLPRDVKGFAALTYSHKQGSDDQWMYLPQMRRVKRIASVNQAGPFVGSEFAYEDIGSQEPEQYTYKFIGDDTFEDRKCLVIERHPVDENSGYSRQVVWVDAQRRIPLKIDYYDRKSELLKTLTNRGYKLYEGRFWKPDSAEMVNHQVGKRTVVEYSSYTFATGLRDADVAVAALKRLR